MALFAVPQDIEISGQVAENFLDSRSEEVMISDSYLLDTDGVSLVYIFNTDPDGFVAVSADNDLYPIIAYSFKNQIFERDRDENLLHRMLIADITSRKKYYDSNPAKATQNHEVWEQYINNQIETQRFQQWPPEGSTITDGWVETCWNQTGVYNAFCPLDNSGQRSVVGCVATAMAMIIDFHEYVGTVSFSNADDFISGWSYPYMYIDDDHETRDFPSFPELNEYLDDVIIHYENDVTLTNDDLAALNFACGVSVEMMYSSTGSGAYTSDVAYALLDKFNYDSANYMSNYGANFYNTLSSNMITMQPAEMSIRLSGGGGGHAIICDGYNSDDYYHLNYGWGTSNNTCWYLLPGGMPSGYSIISGAVVNIEGGEAPIYVEGNVNVEGSSPVGTCITLEGEKSYGTYVTNENGNFEFPAVLTGYYTATAILEDRTYYQQIENLYIDEENDFIQFNLGNFEAVTGTVTAPVSSENCYIALYQDEILVHTGISNSNGEFSIPDVLPGTYTATASLSGNYFESKEVTITLENQTIDFTLEEFEGDMSLAFSKDPIDIWFLAPGYTFTCAILLTEDDLQCFDSDILTKIRFRSPINSDGGEIYAQIWEDENLLSEKCIEDFDLGEWIEFELNNYTLIEPGKEYYVGYKIHSINGNFAYFDAGPRVLGKGAFIKHTNWMELPPGNFDFNFCIDAIVSSSEYGVINGNVQLSGGPGEVTNAVIKTENYIAHPDDSGNYSLFVKSGLYDVSGFLNDYYTETISGININETSLIVNDINFVLTYGVETDEDNLVPIVTLLYNNYPNPFNPSTTISFSTVEDSKNTTLEIYNFRGQKVKTLVNDILEPGEYSVVWNGRNDNNRAVSSGIYYYKMKAGNYSSIKKMTLLK